MLRDDGGMPVVRFRGALYLGVSLLGALVVATVGRARGTGAVQWRRGDHGEAAAVALSELGLGGRDVRENRANVDAPGKLAKAAPAAGGRNGGTFGGKPTDGLGKPVIGSGVPVINGVL